jgi:hypothetical protein
MSDKLKQGIVVVPEFVDGETVRAAKLNSLGSQLQRAASLLEKAVGDMHDESYPYSSLNSARLSLEWGRSMTSDAALTSTATRALDIANLARLIGPASNLNPYTPFESPVFVTENVPAAVYEFSLRFPATTISSSTDAGVVTLKASADLLTTAGDYCIDSKGRVATYTITTGGTVTYAVDAPAWGSGPNYTGATFNVIPDPNQLEAGGAGCTVSGAVDSQGRHTATMPTATHLIRNVGESATLLTVADPLYLERIYLPRVLVDNYSSEEVIPAGFLYLKNWTTGDVYKDAVYYYSNAWTILVGGVDLSDEVAAGDKFVVVTVGTDITTTLDDVRHKLATHNHDRSRGEMPIDASDVVGWVSSPGSSGRFTISKMPGNYAPQYLHRDGYSSSESALNDKNIMRGDLVMGRSGMVPGGYYSDGGTTKGLYFGTTAGPRILKDSATELMIKNPIGAIEIETSNFYFDVATSLECSRQLELRSAGNYTIYMLGINFIPLNYSSTNMQSNFTEGYTNTTINESAMAQLAWRIPNGSTLTNMEMYTYISDAAENINVQLYKIDKTTGVGTSVASMDTGATTGSVQHTNTTTFSSATIDHNNYQYMITATWSGVVIAPRLYSVGFTFTTTKLGN